MTRYPECAATDEGPGANYPTPSMGNFMLSQLRESSGNPFRACVRASAGFHSRMAKKYGVDSPQGMAHYKLAEAFGNPTTKLQEFITKGGEFGDIEPKAVCRAHKDSIKYHKKQAEKAGLHTPMGHAHVSAMAHHVDELNQAKQKMQASQFGHTGRHSPVPGIPKKSEQPSQDIRQKKPLIKLKPRSAECNIGKEAGVKGMKWHQKLAAKYGYKPKGKDSLGRAVYVHKGSVRGGESNSFSVYPDGNWNHNSIRFSGTRSEPSQYVKFDRGPESLEALLRKRHGIKESSSDNYVAQRYDDSHPEGFKSPAYANIKPGGVDREGGKKSFESRKRKFEARIRAGGPGSGPPSSGMPFDTFNKSICKRCHKPFPQLPRKFKTMCYSCRQEVKKARQKPVGESEEARAFGRQAFGPVHAGGPGSGPKSVQKSAPPRLSQAAFVQKVRQKPVDESEVAPPGWEGAVKSMKKHKDIENPWALAWSMKKAGAKPHKKESGERAGWKNGSVLVRPQHLVAAVQPKAQFYMKEF